jgi:hypothetical protein
MTITVAVLAGLIIGIAVGAVVAGLALTERRSRHWVVVTLRLPEDLHHRLKEAARDHMWDLLGCPDIPVLSSQGHRQKPSPPCYDFEES